ncbi:MAG: amidohydrolase [Bacteroidetes bacterium]|nr:MAG: amidohydrolase [Bacteroidota bacterium]
MRYSILFLFLAASLLLTSATEPPVIKTIIAEDMPYLLDFYKTRHENPEISLQEKETAATLTAELQKIGFEVTENFGGYGIVGIYKNGKGPTILYRTDMDALPMYEKTELPYKSKLTTEYNGQEIGTMHSCGHDMHMTSWLGTARAMVEMKKEWKGTLMLIGQPAEEIGAGARLMLNEGLYQKFGVPDYGFGLHCSATIEVGKVGFGKGYTMANTESADIIVKGVGAHGASPQMSIDPIVMASMIVMELQTIVSRNLKPTESAVVTVGAIQGGIKHNIIPDEVTLKLTIRTYKEDVRLMVHKRIEEITRGIAIASGVPENLMPVVTFPGEFTPANYNDSDLVDIMSQAASKSIGEANVLESEPLMLGEDFALYGSTPEKVPTVLYWLGTAPKERLESNNIPGLHSPYYYPIPENSIKTAISVNTNALLELFAKK